MEPNIKETFEATRLLVNPRSPKVPFQHAATLEEALALVAISSAQSMNTEAFITTKFLDEDILVIYLQVNVLRIACVRRPEAKA